MRVASLCRDVFLLLFIFTFIFSFRAPAQCPGSGTILREQWNDLTGYSISSIPVNTAPASTSQLASFEAPYNVGDNYGARIRGYICAPTTGNYIFWIASDDKSELWLSTNDDPANKVKIAYVNGWTNRKEWTKYSTQQSAPVALVAGQRYYIEALHKEAIQGDHVEVGWKLPGGTLERPIPGSRLSPPGSTGNTSTSSTQTLIAAGETWKYLDNGSNAGTSWKELSYNDNAWKSGKAQLGYGDGDEATVVSYGTSSSNKYITTYFRKGFTINNPSSFTSLTLNIKRDDGAVVYLNGIEVFRTNMPAGTIGYTTRASAAIDGSAESAFNEKNIPVSLLQQGTNVIAVEVHQSSSSSSDISFDLKLTGSTTTTACSSAPTGLGASNITASSATLTWNTMQGATSYNLRYKPSSSAVWSNSTSSSNTKSISDLAPSTQYQFQVQAACSSGSTPFSDTASFSTVANVPVSNVLVTKGSSWKYLDNGTNAGTLWKEIFYDDGAWKQGNAQLGYGDGDEATVVSYGSSSSNKYITTYFRKTFSISAGTVYNSLSLDLLRDDGAIIYLNGTEVLRTNMSEGSVSYTSLATAYVDGAAESAFITANLPASLLRTGTNVIAAEIHQSSSSSSDISFDLKLTGSSSNVPSLTRGPYLQLSTPGSIYIRWRTDLASASRVRYGISPGEYTMSVFDTSKVQEHVVRLTGLAANTRYYYSVETSSLKLQGDNTNYFYTNPTPGTVMPVRIWAIGDFGTGQTIENRVRDSYNTYNSGGRTNVWLWLGDNAYPAGADADFQQNIFTGHYENVMKNTVAWPAYGNHDAMSANSQTQSGTYFNILTLPAAGEAGGVPSGTEAYYSFNYANIHFICLESNSGTFTSTGSAMLTWLSQDLAANTQQWTVVYFHHPPYSKGSHDSDTETELVRIRQNVVPILEQYNVDLVISGHSHSYERSYFMHGHYGQSSSFDSSMVVQQGSGTFPQPYTKTSPGTVYVVCGSSGELHAVAAGWPHPAMYYSTATIPGSMVIDVNGERMDVRYLGDDGIVRDEFSMLGSLSSSRMAGADSTTIIDASPNPFSRQTEIQYVISEEAPVSLEVYDALGRMVHRYQEQKLQPAGTYHVTFSPADLLLETGVYFIKITVNGKSEMQKVIFTK